VGAALAVLPAAAHADTASSQSGLDSVARHVVFTISSPQIVESSSLVVSTRHPGLVYTTNDSGDSATVYVLNSSNGNLVGRTRLRGVRADDFEAMAGGSGGSLIIGDIGDNHAERRSIRIYKIRQPGRGHHVVTPDAVTLRYSDGPRNAEAILYDSSNGRAFVVSKVVAGPRVYRTPYHVFRRSHALLQPRARAPVIATDATFIRHRHFAVIRTYFGAVVYRYPQWARVASFDLPTQPQGESIAAPPGGRYVWVGTEGRRSAVLRVLIPRLASASGSGSSVLQADTPPTMLEAVSSDAQPDARVTSAVWLVGSAAAAGLVVVLGTGLILLRRHRSSFG
jgi:hypothetical protein